MKDSKKTHIGEVIVAIFFGLLYLGFTATAGVYAMSEGRLEEWTLGVVTLPVVILGINVFASGIKREARGSVTAVLGSAEGGTGAKPAESAETASCQK